MDISIQQRNISLVSQYDIISHGEKIQFAKSQLFRLLTHIEIITVDTNEKVLEIQQRIAIIGDKYDIRFPNGGIANFRTKSIWQRHYQCYQNHDLYDIYYHRKLDYSVYKNGVQVASWTKEAVKIIDGDNYNIIARDDCDKDLLIALCIILDQIINEDETEIIKYSFGRSGGGEAKVSNPNWHPPEDENFRMKL
jgi:uncharacterized protein YxjI